MIERCRRILALTAVAWLAAGCTILLDEPPPPPSSEEIAAAAEEMAALPRSAEAVRSLREAMIHIAAAASAVEPRLVWSWGEPGGEGPCTEEYANIGGIRVTLPRYVADGPVPPRAWPEFRATAAALAAGAGAEVMKPDLSTPDNHYVDFEGTDGTFLGNRTSLSVYTDHSSTTITATTGCRLP
ncbi:LppA family lipoprotein [Nocardia higoensis]|uniref:LppA family lipoprotein n=1 Tax=Nocardia higoensis TaxID=228599 RepID=UPI0002DDE81A|nr:LppA family lipoprotein [Nocardia higoensis]